MTEGDPSRGGWTRWDVIVASGLAMVFVALVGSFWYERERDSEAQAREDVREQETRECVIKVVEDIRIYLNERGEIAGRDRESVNRVIRAAARAARTESQDPSEIVEALRAFEEIQRNVREDRKNSQLSDFPTGQCVEDLPPLEEPDAVLPTRPDGTDEDEPAANGPQVAPREDKGKRSSRKSPKEPSPSPEGDRNPPLPELPEVPDPASPELPELSVSNLLSVQVGDGIKIDLLPEALNCDPR